LLEYVTRLAMMSSAEPLPGYGVDDMRNLSAYFYEVTKMEFEAKFFACKFHFITIRVFFLRVFRGQIA
jgi:hypothetical protein